MKIKLIIAVASMIAISGCSDAKTAERVLKSNGYTDVKTTGHSFFSCGKDDGFSTGFIARSPNGTLVKGAVCSNLIGKGATIRFE